ncbi:hypothetical protein [Pontibacter fetidus]|uniref:Uncharacterized protein n=1 Tax=Pontibacter fetidus TaxID=2700082 RepID=A0A6B2H7D1_9BACT|nr:hypothetical protein [Pontibacter fetidus]NDK55014.1 hypothetical protein [Pontibacter fetidus]
MKNIKTIIAYLLVAVFLLGSIAASARAVPENPVNRTTAIVTGAAQLIQLPNN